MLEDSQVELLRIGKACHVVRDYIHHFANPARLRILCELTLGERTVNELVEAVGARQSSVSQQLSLLRLAGLVDRTNDGSKRVYRLTDPLARATMEYLVGLAEKLMERQESKPADELGDDECICS
jgi:ArsR family transcriptional regulator